MSPQNKQGQKQHSLFGIVFFPVLIVGILIVAAILIMSYSGDHRAAPSPQDNDHQLSSATMDKLRNQYDKLGESIGDPQAPVTIREFGDYQCPACRAFDSTAQRIRQQYVKSGKVRFIFFDFPLSMHPNSQPAAIAARCAARQGKFWPYHTSLYQAQPKWVDQSDPHSIFLDLALENGLDTDQLEACMKAKKPQEAIQGERKAGQLIQLRATPTVLVNNAKLIGPSWDKIKQAIDDASSGSDNE